MGIRLIKGSSCNCNKEASLKSFKVDVFHYDKNSINPDPKNFKILDIEEIGNYVIAKIRYPNCTNYEGNKILVFHGRSKTDILAMYTIDPHFCDNCDNGLIARFAPTKAGWNLAHSLINSCYK